MITTKQIGETAQTTQQWITKFYQEIMLRPGLKIANRITTTTESASIALFRKWENMPLQHGQLDRLIHTPTMEQQSM